MCNAITLWGEYEYLRLPMGVMWDPDIFQDKMGTLMESLEFAQIYLYDLLCLSRGSFNKHLSDVEELLVRLRNTNLKVNA